MTWFSRLLLAGAIVTIVGALLAAPDPAVAQEPGGPAAQSSALTDQVCCQRGLRRLWSTADACVSTIGGFPVDDPQCDTFNAVNEPVCCQRGLRRLASTAGQCQQIGGEPVDDPQCETPAPATERVCCQRGSRRVWLAPGACQAIGVVVAAAQCERARRPLDRFGAEVSPDVAP